MSKTLKKVTKEDLLSLDNYSSKRKLLRKALINLKKNRRISIGPYANFYFECYETMLAQIQEMLYIEKGGEQQLKDELSAYNPLIPQGNELIATLMFEIDNPLSRSEFLNKIGGIEEKIFLKIGENNLITAFPEMDVDRTSEEGKASSVQFLHFSFTNDQVKDFKDFNNKVILSIEHKIYNHSTTMDDITRKNLIKDFF